MRKKNKLIILFFLFLLILSSSIFLSFVLKEDKRKIPKEENIVYYPPSGAYFAADLFKDPFYTWKGTLFFLFYSSLYGFLLTILCSWLFSCNPSNDYNVTIFFSLFFNFLFYSFIFPVFLAFGNYKDWVRFYSRLNVSVMALLLIAMVLLRKTTRFYR